MGNSNDDRHHGSHRHIHNNDASARVEVAHRNQETQAKRIAYLRDNGYEVCLMLAHPNIVTYHLQQRLVVVAISHSQSRNNSHCDQQAALYPFILFQLLHFYFAYILPCQKIHFSYCRKTSKSSSDMTKVQIKSHTPHSFCRNIFYCGALDAPFISYAVIRMRFRKLLYCNA